MPKFGISGFTLLETLIALFILALITSFTIPNLRNLNKDVELNLATSRVVSAIERVQTWSIAGERCRKTPSLEWRVNFYETHFNIEVICQLIDSGPQSMVEPQEEQGQSSEIRVNRENEPNLADNVIIETSSCGTLLSNLPMILTIDKGKMKITCPPPTIEVPSIFCITLKNTKTQAKVNIKMDEGGIVNIETSPNSCE
ncbi:type II secretion system protein [Candidatus Daviesbacteria bacterium]|nr:type II secretion system protein [Candidatus Daviesbacteria bacterium]